MAIRLYETKMEFDYDSSDGSVKKTHVVYIESDGLYFEGTIYGTGQPGVIVDIGARSPGSGLSTGDFEFQTDQIAFGSSRLVAKADGSGVIFSGTLGCTLDSVEPSPLIGTNNGFASGGYVPSFGHSWNDIEKFPIAISSGTATDVGSLSAARIGAGGVSSQTDGFTVGGEGPSAPPTNAPIIDKWPFAISSGTATNVGSIPAPNAPSSSNSSPTHGFHTINQPSNNPLAGTIQSFPYSISSGSTTNVGSSPPGKAADRSGHSSYTHGYISGGRGTQSGGDLNQIKVFPFAISSGSASQHGTLINKGGKRAGFSSETHGFTGGYEGYPGPSSPPFDVPTTSYSDIEKFPFASGTPVSDIGDLGPVGITHAAAISAGSNGLSAGGVTNPGATAVFTHIYKFPFAQTSGTATDVGDLAMAKYAAQGHQD